MKAAGRIIILFLLCVPLAVFGKEQKLTIMHTNDMHSHFLGFPPNIDYTPQVAGDDKTKGGWARIKTVILPKNNKKDLDDIPSKVFQGLKFVFVDHMDQVLKVALLRVPHQKEEKIISPIPKPITGMLPS